MSSLFRVPLLVLALAVLGSAYLSGYRQAAVRLQIQVEASASAQVQSIAGILATQRAVTATLSEDALVLAALVSPTDTTTQAVSQKLDRLRIETGSTIIYLLDRTGVAIAASNWDEDRSFVGQNYAFRDYFQNAVRDGSALQFAMGSVSGRPGLYLSHDVQDGTGVIGVVAVKMEFGPLETAWARGGDTTYVTDADGVVVLSSEEGTRFAPLPEIAGGLTVSLPVEGRTGWTLRHTVPVRPAVETGLLWAGVVLLLELVALAFAARSQRMRRKVREDAERAERYRQDLERAVEERTHDLRSEMAERHAAEARLARLQADLVQANKLATLGQVAAGIAHEVNQPLATIRLLAENGRSLMSSAPAETADNLDRIVTMTERIGQITSHLRGFARKATGTSAPVVLRDVIDASILLTASRRRADGAVIQVEGESDLTVLAESVRLEQILVNLIQNAQDATEGQAAARITITIRPDAETVTITVQDTGPGVSPAISAQLFTPFATSKSGGLGLGLVIARDIARDLGGDLVCDTNARGGCFVLTLERA